MSSPYHLFIRGEFVIVGKEPDGDSVRFIAEDPELFQGLRNGHRVRLSGDGSVQLRFEGVDAPELHYGKEEQPLGRVARDNLLEWMGFGEIEYEAGSTVVSSASPDRVPGGILSKAVEVNGRPVSFVLLEAATEGLADGDWAELDVALLEKTLNARLLDSGAAYYTVYTSTPHRLELRQLASAAREETRGVWSEDSTSEFVLRDQASIGPEGELILPKLFRRCTDYLKAVREEGFVGNLVDWIVQVSAGGSRKENDRVVIGGAIELSLSDLIDQRNRTIVFQPDLLDLTFVEK